jgi:hypothetical protein
MTFPTGGDVITAMEFVGSTLYGGFTTEVAPGGPTSLVTIDTTTGGVSVVGATGIGTPLGGLAFDGATMYAVTAGGSVGELYTIDLLSGTASLVGPTGFGMTALEFGSDGVLYGLPNQRPGFGGHLLSINTLTGAGTDLGDLGIFNLNALTSPIPIPPAVWLFGSGLLGLIGVSRRKTSA